MSRSGEVAMRWWWRGAVVVAWGVSATVALSLGGCGRSGVLLDDQPDPATMQLTVQVNPESLGVYERFEFCWEGVLVAPGPVGEGDAEATVNTYESAPANDSYLVSEPSEDLRPGTWRVRYRLTGLRTALPPVILINTDDCRDASGLAPEVTAGLTTIVNIIQSNPTQCGWYATSNVQTPTMGVPTPQACPSP